jgi:drug/metabolite transporter (DMT)-like permease
MSPRQDQDQDPQDSENEIGVTSTTNTNANVNVNGDGDGDLELQSYYEGMNVSSDMILPLLSNDNIEESTGTSISDTTSDSDGLSLFGIPVRSVMLLNLVAVIWGTQHSVVKMVVDGTSASDSTSSAAAFTLARFAIAALVASPFTPNVMPFLQTVRDKLFGESQADSASTTITYLDNQGDSTNLDNSNDNLDNDNNDNVLAWRWGLEMGCWMFLGYAFQAVGLESTTATKSGFILYLNVKFVPFFARVLFGRRISVPTWISAATALTGTALLTIGDDVFAKGSSGILQSFNVGDAWSLAAAAASALFILRLESASNAVKDSSALNAASLWVVTSLSFLWTLWDAASRASGGGIGMAFDSIVQSISLLIQSHGWQLVYLGAVTTALANYLQTTGQRGMSAERAAVIYAMDPVYGALFAHWLLGENLSGAYGYAGAALITVAAATNAFLDFGSKSTKEKSETINANNANATATNNEDATEER